MPNWCEGNIRFRGKMDDILKLLEENIVWCHCGDEGKTIVESGKVEVSDDNCIITLVGLSKKSWCYISETNRNFIDLHGGNVIESSTVIPIKDGEECIVVFSDFIAAWSIEAEPYIEMSKKYNVDIRILGWEQGMEFDQDIEIVKGELVKNVVNSGSDGEWIWTTAMPYMGG